MIKLNLGCGARYLDGYINVDYSPITSEKEKLKCDIVHNLKFGLPFDKDYADYILLSQVLEHFNRHDGLKLLFSIYEVLKPGGIFELSVPPAEQQMKKFLIQMRNVKSIDDFIYAHEKWTAIKWHDDVAGGTVETVYDDQDIGDFMSHKTFFSKNMLKVLLEHVGFKILEIDDKIEAKVTK